MKTKFRVLSVIMTVAMILSSLVIVVPTTVSAETDTTLWSDVASIKDELFDYNMDENEEPVGGVPGSAENPYQIDSAAELALLAYYVNNNVVDEEFHKAEGTQYRYLHYVVMADIDASAHQWMPIGNLYAAGSNDFQGTFDGGNFTITTAITNSAAYASYVNPKTEAAMTALGGLFGRVFNATIKNVKLNTTITNLSVTGLTSNNIGGLAGAYFATTADNCHININASGTWAEAYCFGGIAGYANANGLSVTNCTVSGTLNITCAGGKDFYGGGIFGRGNGNTNNKTYIKNCISYLDMTVRNTRTGTDDAVQVGGMVGYVNADGDGVIRIENSANFGDLTVTATAAPNRIRSSVGGAIGYAQTNGYVHLDNFANFGQLIFAQQRGTTTQGYRKGSSAAQLIGQFRSPDTKALNVIQNCYTLTGGDAIYNKVAHTKLNGATLETALAGNTYYRMEDLLTHVGIDYEIVEEGEGDAATKKTVVSLNKGAMDILKACGATVTVNRGSASTVVDWETVTATDTVYQIPVATESGAVSVKVEQSVTVMQGEEETVVTVAAETLQDLWIYRAADSYASGDGKTAATAYVIENAAQLARLARDYQQNVLDTTQINDTTFTYAAAGASRYVYYKLGADIDLAGREWSPIGYYESFGMTNAFYGDFNGSGKTIKNMTITNQLPTSYGVGLFGAVCGLEDVVETSATFGEYYETKIYDFNMTGASITKTFSNNANGHTVGLVTAYAYDHVTISGVNASGTVAATTNKGEFSTGGLVGVATATLIKNCSMRGSVSSTTNATSGVLPKVGGLVGAPAGKLDIIGCVNYANVTAENACSANSNSLAGGIIAVSGGGYDSLDTGLTIDGCANYGKITLKGNLSNARGGGIIGNIGRGSKNQPVTITNCINTGDVVLSKSSMATVGYGEQGAIVGKVEGTGKLTVDSVDHYVYNISGVYMPHKYYNSIGNDANKAKYAPIAAIGGSIYVNGATATSQGVLTGSIAVPNMEHYFEVGVDVDGETATITATKISLDCYLAAGYTMALTYGETTITSTEAAASTATAYTWTVPAVDGAAPKLVMTRGTDVVESGKGTWAGAYVADEFAGGTGTEADPYLITNGGEFGLLAKRVNNPYTADSYRSKYYKLADANGNAVTVDLTGHEWVPIGIQHNASKPFNGVIFGNDSVIEGLTLTGFLRASADGSNRYTYQYTMSMFGYVNGNFSLTDVTFNNPVIGTKDYLIDINSGSAIKGISLIAGSFYGGTLEDITVNNLDMYMRRARSGCFTGIFAGYMNHNDAVLRNCVVNGNMTVNSTDNSSSNGALVGRLRAGTVENCVSNVNMDITMSTNNVAGGSLNVGGLIGLIGADKLSDESNVLNNVNNGNVTVTHTQGGKYASVAGIAGAAYAAGKNDDNTSKNATVVIDGNVNTGNIKLVSSTASGTKEVAGILGIYTYSAITLKNNIDFTNGKLYGVSEQTNTDVVPTITDDGSNFSINTGLTTQNSAAVRLNTATNDSGLRFTSNFITAKYDELVAKYGEGSVTFGTVIAPTALIDKYQANQLPVSVDVPYDVAVTAKGDRSVFTGAIQNIKDITRDFTAVAYMTIKVGEESYTIYADYAGEEGRSRNMKDVADRAFSDRYDVAGEYDGYDYYTNYGDENGFSCYSAAQLDLLVDLYGAEFKAEYKPVVEEAE